MLLFGRFGFPSNHRPQPFFFLRGCWSLLLRPAESLASCLLAFLLSGRLTMYLACLLVFWRREMPEAVLLPASQLGLSAAISDIPTKCHFVTQRMIV